MKLVEAKERIFETFTFLSKVRRDCVTRLSTYLFYHRNENAFFDTLNMAPVPENIDNLRQAEFTSIFYVLCRLQILLLYSGKMHYYCPFQNLILTSMATPQ